MNQRYTCVCAVNLQVPWKADVCQSLDQLTNCSFQPIYLAKLSDNFTEHFTQERFFKIRAEELSLGATESASKEFLVVRVLRIDK